MSQRETLHDAVLKNLINEVKRLLEEGADPNETDEHGLTPLHLVALYNKPEIADILLQHGANPNLRNYEPEDTPLHKVAVGN